MLKFRALVPNVRVPAQSGADKMTAEIANIITLLGAKVVRVVPWLGPAGTATFALLLLWPRMRGKVRERRMRRVIERCGLDFVKDVMLPDGMDGITHIDYLLLRPDTIVVADLKRYQGILFGAEHIDQWTQLVGQKSFKFPNPLFKNELDVMAVKAQVPAAPITGRVIFSDEGSFPKGIPAGVSMLGTLAQDLGVSGSSGQGSDAAGSAAPREPSAAVASAWQALRSALAQASAGGARERGRGGGSGIVMASLLLALSCAWALWMLRATLFG
ncbi:MAG TPA: nuclease-related domain-containing protein [Gammaproteobacteria bacterium]|nr:nuclease-related domain-containing protein [Gammaproteobacteria bacterium]